MRAILLRRFGPPEVLEPADVEDPVPGPGEVLVEVSFAGITFVETQLRRGRAPNPAMLYDLPAIPGNGVGGSVDGTRVVSTTGGHGGYAERVAVPRENLIEVPRGMDLAEATALLADGRTAMSLMRTAAIEPGETVVVEAAAGGVGSLLVQLVKAAGARVVGLAGGARKRDLVSGLGADVAVDYAHPGWEKRLGETDVVFDGVGGDVGAATFRSLRPGGRFVPFGGASGRFARVRDEDAEPRGITIARGSRLRPDEMSELTRAALAEAAAGRLRPVIGQRVPLERAAEAHAAIEARETVGKTLLVV